MGISLRFSFRISVRPKHWTGKTYLHGNTILLAQSECKKIRGKKIINPQAVLIYLIGLSKEKKGNL